MIIENSLNIRGDCKAFIATLNFHNFYILYMIYEINLQNIYKENVNI